MRKKTLKIIVSIAIVFSLTSCNDEVKSNGIKKIQKCNDCLVKKEETAVKIGEAVLFEMFSQKKIEGQKPYIVTIKNDSIWVMDGTFNKIGYGGTFHIEISSKNGRIIDVFHYK